MYVCMYVLGTAVSLLNLATTSTPANQLGSMKSSPERERTRPLGPGASPGAAKRGRRLKAHHASRQPSRQHSKSCMQMQMQMQCRCGGACRSVRGPAPLPIIAAQRTASMGIWERQPSTNLHRVPPTATAPRARDPSNMRYEVRPTTRCSYRVLRLYPYLLDRAGQSRTDTLTAQLRSQQTITGTELVLSA